MSPETARFNGLRALVVEDETIIALLVEDMLKELGFNEVVKASSVPQAIAALETAPPDIVILDVNLAGVQAYPVAERLQSPDAFMPVELGNYVLRLPPTTERDRVLDTIAAGVARHGIPEETHNIKRLI